MRNFVTPQRLPKNNMLREKEAKRGKYPEIEGDLATH
jgi:hypothetical protein